MVPLRDLAAVRTGLAKGRRAPARPVRLPYLRVANVQEGRLDLADVKTIEVEAGRVERFRLRRGDVLLTEGGDYDKLGRGTVWQGEIERCLHQNHIFVVRVDPSRLDPWFLAALTASPYGRRYFRNAAKRTTTLASISATQLQSFPVLLPPLAEQREIVRTLTAIEVAIARNDEVVAALANLRTAFIAHLFSRGLPGAPAPGTRIRTEGSPASWDVAPLGTLLTGIDTGWSPRCQPRPAAPGAWGVLKVSSVSWGRFRPEENKHLPSGLDPRPELAVRPGDLLLSRANTPQRVGSTVIVHDTPPRLMLCDKLFRLHCDEARLLPGYLHLALEAPAARTAIREAATGSSRSMKNISQKKLKQILIPVPSLGVQRQIVAVVDGVERRIEHEHEACAALRDVRWSLMAALFSGALRVPLTPAEAGLVYATASGDVGPGELGEIWVRPQG